MAYIDILNIYYWGADKLQITEGDGSGFPQVVSASALSRNQVKVTFDRDMLFQLSESEILKCHNYHIEDHEFNRTLYIIRAEKILDTEVLLITQDHENILYDLIVNQVQDKYGNPIGVNNTAQYTGISPDAEFPTASKVYSFWGLYTGMESSEETGITPDPDPPYVDTQDPSPSEIQVDKDKIITFHLKDDYSGVNLLLTRIYIGGNLAYDGPTDTWTPPFNGPGSAISGTANDYAVAIDRTSSYDSYELVDVRVVAADLRPVPNYLDTTWSFTISDFVNPTITNEFPTGIDISKTTIISLTVQDIDGSGINQSLVNIVVDGVPAVTNGVIVAPFDGPASYFTPNASVNGFDICMDTTTQYSSFRNIYVVVSMEDNEGNPGSGFWSFRIEDYEGPLITPISPINAQEGVPLDSNIIVKIEDDQNIAAGTSLIEIDINGGGFDVAWEDGGIPEFKPNWDGPDSIVVSGAGIKTITIDPVSSLPFAAIVTIRITSEDVEGNPERI